MNKLKSIVAAMLIFVLSICFAVPAFADDDAVQGDITDRRGSITVSLKSDDFALADVEITVFRIADAVFNAANELEFDLIPELIGFGDYPKDNDANTLRRLAAYAREHNIEPLTEKTDSEGLAVFTHLQTGSYLVVQTGHVEGFTTCSPFIIALPVIEDNGIIYDIDASPKNDVERLIDISVKKVWNDVGSHPASVKVKLLNNGETVDTVELNAENNWSYKWESQLQSDAYSIEEVDIPVGWHASYTKNGYEFTVTNSSKLIQTGQHNLPVLILAFSGLFCFIIGWAAIYVGNRKEENE